MKPEELKSFVQFMKENDLTELEVKGVNLHLKLKKKDQKIESELSEEEDFVKITSPLIGTFYRAPSPASPPFVEIDREVKEGDTLCIVEAMKVMNKIKAEKSGVIKKILAENGKIVEYGQLLFLIEPT
ncbi:MAG: acetyl-CoA carboxylase, biotin carboxyl carrier protein [bacterium (Candidatus Ratteibacteria) CG_4_10_14_3_um_filter_41_18]|uniref:Biotin carboxyl carrier protein of acetyl-CoA carboxylase n=4 Tax=Candidatus Ratteibacteria TaxID=2979319 RepID=A0A2M7YF12_9BACT|nr:MAG: acetyl-CoA carboxylase, biotin carboxyl carrier protein [bacterium (Candidatus Ratteibacteria) CG01_land_8_20_14_3_00_40_19]PIW30918.1 MAG: acetyl-CoA carboxylase, biotin carboxyl carrier protein [bacterium (Candidatus Ratteibacteria) CG15_BIG_FIL_POST_REV_8_21_14_020_41_12]PIX77645.1 MAG: acetyl-CoA carboxylase, biotin carboxyl carrier protein [bacterium (Candidatus Ratteibacteria) CG_4_10_14_3_um_filter_41_18]PJA61572.1 MAG: acetyl-CoA carboxylase, biotin carboxyl carrier protein [bact